MFIASYIQFSLLINMSIRSVESADFCACGMFALDIISTLAILLNYERLVIFRLII